MAVCIGFQVSGFSFRFVLFCFFSSNHLKEFSLCCESKVALGLGQHRGPVIYTHIHMHTAIYPYINLIFLGSGSLDITKDCATDRQRKSAINFTVFFFV